MPKFIDATPTWPQATQMLRLIIEQNPDPEAKEAAWVELGLMAILAQAWSDRCREARDEAL